MPRIWRIGSPNQEQPITNDNIMVFSVQYVLQYKIGTWYLPGTIYNSLIDANAAADLAGI